MGRELKREFLDGILTTARWFCTFRDLFQKRHAALPKPRRGETISLCSGSRVLDGRFVPARDGMPVVLFCHGIGDKLEHWDGVQAFFEERGIGSMFFSYSGYGKSTGRVRKRHYDEDFLVAYEEVQRRVSPETPVFVVGYSLGSGVAARGVRKVEKAPAGLFLCSGFTSFREAGMEMGAPRWLASCVPDVWRTAKKLSEIEMQVVVVHSDKDELFSMRMAEGLAAGRDDVELVPTYGFSHSEPLYSRAEKYWAPITERILAVGAAS